MATLVRTAVQFKLSREESRLGLQTLMKSTSEGVLVCKDDGTIVAANEALHGMFGYSGEELLGRSVETLLAGDRQDQHQRDRRTYHTTGIPRRMTVLRDDPSMAGSEQTPSGRHKDGSEVPIEIDLSPTQVGGETLTLAIVRDVSESRAALEARLHLASIVDASTDAVVRMDLDGTVTGWNKSAEDMFGYTEDEIIGEHSSRLAKPGQEAERDDNFKRILRGEAVFIAQAERVRKDGRPIELSVSVFPLQNAAGSVIGFAAVARDITEQLKLERQFQEAQRMEAIGQLAGGIAHDFNNLLTVISGYSSLMQDQLPDDSPMRSSLRAQSAASDRGAALTRQLLAFGRKQRFEPKIFELNKAVSELHDVLHRTLGEDVELVTILTSKGYIEADPAQLEQVILNLAVNARHAMPRGGKLKIGTSDVELDEARVSELGDITPGRYSLMTVSDTGTGMDQDTVPHIFEPFFTTKEKGEGTGLGLAAVYGIVKQSKGAISVRSKPGVGTVFDIYLRQVPAPDLDLPEVLGDGEIPRGEGTILLIEDDEDVRELAAHVLQTQGFSVVVATGVQEAEAAVKGDTPIDLVLTDVVMPETNGPQLVERLRTRRSNFKVLYMTGYTDNTSESYRLVSGHAVLDKPFRPADLVRKVNGVLRGS